MCEGPFFPALLFHTVYGVSACVEQLSLALPSSATTPGSDKEESSVAAGILNVKLLSGL